ncbi:MAG: ATP-binding cassette domain-containing protein [Clostridia bacterium]|nr:ATP-binding cassette domain-containing protein [Clostridia bacterium]MDE7328791.1 ATP-binding cassette domain-containing protein [Clostridia bacterium]
MIINNLSFAYGDKPIFKAFDLVIPCNKVTCIMGESGCGKTTLLNCISKRLAYEGEIDYGRSENGLLSDKAIAYVFQQPRLVPSMTVKENIEYVLKGSKKDKEDRAKDILAKLQLSDCANSYPRFISGGQAGRAALARALAIDSDILLLDEPFKGLDLKLKSQILALLLPLIKEKTVVFVTHDAEDALAVGDAIYVLKREVGDSVNVVAKEEIALPKENRNLYCDEINKARQNLFNTLLS